MVSDLEKNRCTGCAVCMNICPKNSIKMESDEEGFLYPYIDTGTCIGCNLCQKACPVMNVKRICLDHMPEAKLAWAADSRVVEHATSGGLFYALATEFIKSGGYVIGAAYHDVYKVHHVVVDAVEKLPDICRSKYVQSEIGNAYATTEKLLNNGTKVLFSGTGCQTYGLISYLKAKKISTNNLITVDVVCHGVPSPLVMEKYIDYMEHEYQSKVTSLRMREKKRNESYATDSTTVLNFADNSVYQEYSGIDYFDRLFYGGISSRPSCYHCSFKTVGRITDLTIGDCWFSRNLTHDKTMPYDVTLVLIHTKKGKELINSDCVCKRNVDTEDAIKVNGGMIYKSCIPHPKRSEFFTEIQKGTLLSTLTEQYFPSRAKRSSVFLKSLKKAVKTLPCVRIYRENKYYWEKGEEFNRRCAREIPSDSKVISIL